MVGTIIHRKVIHLAVKTEMAIGNTVCIPAGGLARAGAVAEVCFGVIIPEHNISQLAVGFGEADCNNTCAER